MLFDVPSPLSITAAQLLGAFVVVGVTLLLRRWTRFPANLPPGPTPSLLGGNRGLIPRERPWLKLAEIGKQYPRGYYTLWTGPKPTIVVTSARVAADLMDKRSNIYSSRPRSVVAGELMSGASTRLCREIETR